MGYYTSYELKIKTEDEEKLKSIFDYLLNDEQGKATCYGLNIDSVTEEVDCPRCEGNGTIRQYMEGMDGHLESGEPCKWYKHDEHMTALSKKFPDVVFVLDGEGEETGDMWRKFFKNGEVRSAEVEVKYTEPDMTDWE